MSFRRRVTLWLLAQVICVAVLIGGIFNGQISLHSDVSAFDKSTSRNAALDTAWAELRARQAGNGSVLVSHADPTQAVDAALAVQQGFAAVPKLATVDLTTQQADDLLFAEQLLAAFPGVLSAKDRLDVEQSGGEAVLARALAGLAVPGMAMSFVDPSRDPFDLTGKVLSSGLGDTLPDQLIKGVPVFRSSDGMNHVRVPFEAQDDVTGLADQTELSNKVRSVVNEVLQNRPQLEAHYLGGAFFAADIAKASRAEAERLTLLSAAWVLLVVLIAMRSIRSLLATGLVLGIGLLWGITTASLIWGGVNTVALGFAGGLLGVVADYVFHYFFARPDSHGHVARPTKNALIFGALSSIVGFASLLFASFDLLTQIAVIACAGIAASLATILFLFPAIGLLPVRTSAGQTQFSTQMQMRHKQLVGIVMHPAIGLAMIVLAFFVLKPPMDDVRSLGHMPTGLVQDAELASALFPAAHPTRFLMVAADDSQDLLQKMEAVAPSLRQLQSEGRISSAYLISDQIPSLSNQVKTAELVTETLALSWVQKTGLDLEERTPVPVTLEGVRAVAPGYRALQAVYQAGDGRVWAAIPIVGGTAASVASVAASHESVYLIDPVDSANRAFAQSRKGAQVALLAALGLLWALFCLRNGFARGTRLALVPMGAVFAAPVLAALVGVPLNLLTVMSLFLVLAIGADYAIFLGDPELGTHPETYRAVTLSALSSVGAFAILGTSTLPAIHQIGTVLCAGLAVAWVLSPFSTQVIGTDK